MDTLEQRNYFKLLDEYRKDFAEKTNKGLKFEITHKHHNLINFTTLNSEINPYAIIAMILNYTNWNWYEMFCIKGVAGVSKPPTSVTLKRGIFFYILFHNGVSYYRMSKIFKIDHTSILASVRKFDEELEKDMYIRGLFKEIIDSIKDNYDHFSELTPEEFTEQYNNQKNEKEV